MGLTYYTIRKLIYIHTREKCGQSITIWVKTEPELKTLSENLTASPSKENFVLESTLGSAHKKAKGHKHTTRKAMHRCCGEPM